MNSHGGRTSKTKKETKHKRRTGSFIFFLCLMSLDSYCINYDEDGKELRLLSPLNKTNVTINEMLTTPFGKSLWTIRTLGFNPAYDTTASATAGGGGGGNNPSGSPVTGGGGGGGAGGGQQQSLRGSVLTASSQKVDRIAAVPDGSLVAVSSERVVRLVSADTKGVIAELCMEEKVLNMRANTDVLAVILAKATHFFFIDTLQPLPELRTQWPNANNNGLGALSPKMGSACYFIVSQSLSDKKERGDIFLYNPLQAATLTVIDAHEEPVRCLEFCGNGTRFASCSNAGRKIRIWSCPECIPLFELQRGQTEAIVFSLAMNFDASILALTSNSGTLHIFRSTSATRSVSKITTRQTPHLCFLSPDGSFLFVLYPPDATNKTAKLEKHKLSGADLKGELENEMNLTV